MKNAGGSGLYLCSDRAYQSKPEEFAHGFRMHDALFHCGEMQPSLLMQAIKEPLIGDPDAVFIICAEVLYPYSLAGLMNG